MAVKVTEVPAQIVLPGLAAILTDGVTFAFTVIARTLLVAGEPVAQLKLLVIATLTWFPLANEFVVYVGLVAPLISTPPSFHW